MAEIGTAAAILQILVLAKDIAIKTGWFLHEVKHVRETQRVFLGRVEFFGKTLQVLSKTLERRLEYIGAGDADQDEKEIIYTAKTVLQDCDDSVVRLRALATTTNERGLIARAKAQFKLEIRGPDIQRTEARIEANIGNVQVLVACFHLFIDDDQVVREKRIDSQLDAIAKEVKNLQQFLDKLSHRLGRNGVPINVPRLRSGLSLEVSDSAVDHEEVPTVLEIENSEHEIDVPNLNAITGTILAASSLFDKRSRATNTSESDQRLGHEDNDDVCSVDGGVELPSNINSFLGSISLLGSANVKSTIPPTLEYLTQLLDNYWLKAEEEFNCESYSKCEEYLRKALDYGDRRYNEYGQIFEKRLDIQIKLAEAFKEQGEVQKAERLLSDLLSLASDDGRTHVLEHSRITLERRGKLCYAMADLYRHIYHSTRGIELHELRSVAETAYYTASHLTVMSSSATNPGEPLRDTLVKQCADILLEVCELEGDPVEARTLRERHPPLNTEIETDSERLELPTPPGQGLVKPAVSASSGGRQTSATRTATALSPVFTESDRDRSDSVHSVTGTEISQLDSLWIGVNMGNVPLTRQLLGRREDTEHTDASGLTPLLVAAKNKNLEILQLLLNNERTNIHARDHEGRTMLHHALIGIDSESNANIVNMIVKKGADVNAADNEGRHPLHYCVEYNNCSAAKILLATKKVDVEAENGRSETAAILLATKKKYPSIDMLTLLHSYGAVFDRRPVPPHLQKALDRLSQNQHLNRRSSETFQTSPRSVRSSRLSFIRG